MTNYRHELFERLEPRSEFKGGRIVDTDLLTLTEAASMATRHAGEPVNVGDILRAAGRGEILLRAIIHRRAKLQSHDGGICCNEGHPTDQNVAPAGCIPTLPLSACQHLANTGRASWRTFDGYTEIDGVAVRFDKWMLTDDEPDIETTLEDCRVTGRDVHALADAFSEGPHGATPNDCGATKAMATSEGAGEASRKDWTLERLAELAAYRAEHGTAKAAEKFGISTQRIRQLLPTRKRIATHFAGLGRR